MNDKLYIVMPSYNEEANIEENVKQWHSVIEKVGLNSRLFVFDDGSTDNTYEIMQRLKNKYLQFIPFTKSNTGHGQTCIFAYKNSISAGADFIFQTDSDSQTNPEEFWQFWEKRNDYDFIIGERKKRQDGISRKVVAFILKLIILLIYGVNVKDCNCPFRLMNAKKLKPILEIIPDNFFLSNVIISILVVKKKEKHLWIPISFKPRKYGVNSINLKKIIKIGFKSIFDFYSIKHKIANLKNECKPEK